MDRSGTHTAGAEFGELDNPVPAPASILTERLRSLLRPLDRSKLSPVARFALGRSGGLLFLILVVVYFSVAATDFSTEADYINIASTAAVTLVISLGQVLTIISGGFDLSVGGVVPLGAVTYALLASHGMNWGLALVITLLPGAAVGVANAVAIGLGINALIATLGTMSIASGIALAVAHGLTVSVPMSAGVLGNNGPWQIPYAVYVAVGLTIVTHLVLTRTGFGRRIYVVGGNAEAARVAGIRVPMVRLGVYVISGVLAAFAGVIYASELLAAAGTVGNNAALNSIAAVVLGGASISGGAGGADGTLVGVLVLGVLADGLSLMHISAFYVQIVTGAVLLVAVGLSRLQKSA